MAHAHILTDCTITSSTPSCPTPTPSPSPIPTNAFLSLDVTAGDPNTQITVNGGAFLPNESMTLIWDPPNNNVAVGAVAHASGNFTTHAPRPPLVRRCRGPPRRRPAPGRRPPRPRREPPAPAPPSPAQPKGGPHAPRRLPRQPAEPPRAQPPFPPAGPAPPAPALAP